MNTVPGDFFSSISRRAFAAGLITSALATQLPASAAQAAPTQPAKEKWRAVVIGNTGHGDYGHGLDVIFTGCSNVDVVAVADPDAVGRAKAAERSGAAKQYADYREMLEAEKPELVCLAPRWSNERHAMGFAALRSGAHLICEKPFTTTLAEADELLKAASDSGAKIAVAHQMRLAPSVIHLQKTIADGTIGELLEMHAWGKQDDRAGGEDMIVLGSHLFDLLRLFAGDVQWCTSRVLHQGRDITRQDARQVNEKIGAVAGDEVTAQFAFTNGVNGTFTSRKRLREHIGRWGIEFVGSKGSLRLLADVYPSLYVLKSSGWDVSGRTSKWEHLTSDPGISLSAEERGFGPANRRVVDDWLAAIAQQREPVCSGRNAMKSLEMIMAVYHAALKGARVSLPLADRTHPLEG